jgi:hypothetical protein
MVRMLDFLWRGGIPPFRFRGIAQKRKGGRHIARSNSAIEIGFKIFCIGRAMPIFDSFALPFSEATRAGLAAAGADFISPESGIASGGRAVWGQ